MPSDSNSVTGSNSANWLSATIVWNGNVFLWLRMLVYSHLKVQNKMKKKSVDGGGDAPQRMHSSQCHSIRETKDSKSDGAR